MATKIMKAGVAALLVAAVAGASWWAWERFGQGSGGELGSSAEIGSEAAFAFLECKPRMFDGSPAIAVSFTQPLARGQDFGALAKASEVDPAAESRPLTPRWVLGDNPRVLYLPYVTPDRTYQITLDAGLAAKSGARLAVAPSCSLKSEAMPTSFYFASRGTVLPAEQNGGLPVVTTNVHEVDVQFLRIKAEMLPGFLEQVGSRRERRQRQRDEDASNEGSESDCCTYDDDGRKLKGTVGGYVLDQLRQMSDSVYIGRFATDARRNRRNVNFLPVEKIRELQEPGIYIAVMSQPGRFGWDYQVTHYYVTDIGLHLRRHADQLDVFTTSLTSGKAISGIELSLIDASGKAIVQAKSDGDGHAVFTGNSDKANVLLARRGNKELSMLALNEPALDLSEFDATGHASRNNKLFVYAGRNLYRPGESFTASVLARDAQGKTAAKPLPLTLTLKKPDGSSVMQQLVNPHTQGQGYYEQQVALPADAPTGRWTLQARVDPAAKLPDTAWTFQVEEFVPERMKLDLDAPQGAMLGTARLPVAVKGSYLFGAPAAGNQLRASVHSERQINPLAQKLPGFIFGDFADDKAKQREDLSPMDLDAEGKAEATLAPSLAERVSPMLVRGSFSLLESGGRPVVRSIERSWWPAAQLVAVRPLFERHVVQEGGLAEFEIVRVDGDGKFKPAKGLQLRLMYEERQWYWRYDDGRGWNSGFNTQDELVEARTLDLVGRQKISLPVRWGRYRVEVTDPETRLVLRYAFYAGWGAQDADDMGNRPDKVQLKLLGAPFKPGHKARLAIKPPHDGEALVTVEGDRVLWSKRVGVRTGGSEIEIPIDAAWQRNDLYITVAAFRPGSQGDRVTPTRALGLVHLPLDNEDRKLKLDLVAPAKAQPGQPLPVKVSAPKLAGKAAIVTVSAVDVGILEITRYKTPDPVDFFFGKHRYGADLLDIYGRLIEKMDGLQAKQRFGGDSAGKRDTQSLPRKLLLVDLYSGPVKLDAKGEAQVNLAMPDFNGTVRVMAVVSSADSYASAQAETVVAAPIVAELAMPRFIAPGDKATIALDLTNLSGAVQHVKVALEASGPIKISGGNDAVLELADKQRQILRFGVEATDAYGLVPLKLKISAGKLSLTREAALQVQPATPLTREIRRTRLEPGATHKIDAALLASYWAGSASVDVNVSDKPPIDVRAQVQGLLMYPYGCLEQTTSSAYPLVFIDEASAAAFGLTPVSREERAKRLDVAFGRLAGMQQPRGGFGLWASSSPYEAWLSAYVTGFLQDARAAGFNVPEQMLERSLASLLEQFQRAPNFQTQPPKEIKRDTSGRIADYRDVESLRLAHQRFAEATHAGYILALEQKAPLATLRTLHDSYRANARSPLPLLQLGIALGLMGDEARSKVAIDDAMRRAYGLQPEGADTTQYWGDWMGDYGSKIRDLSLGYALMYRHKLAHERREGLLFDLAADFGRRNYYSTQERLALFLAVDAARAGTEPGKTGWKASLQQAGSSEELAGEPQHRSLSAAKLKGGATLRNDGAAPLFVEVATQGYPVKPPSPQDDRIKVERSLWTTDGQAVSARELRTGELYIVRLRVQARQTIKDGLVVDRIPAGFEIENLNLSQGPQAGEFAVEGVNVAVANANERIAHIEYRDDRFVAALKIDGSATNVFYLVRVVTPGRYVVPAPFAEDMYRPEIRGVGKAEADITVVDPRRK